MSRSRQRRSVRHRGPTPAELARKDEMIAEIMGRLARIRQALADGTMSPEKAPYAAHFFGLIPPNDKPAG